MTFREYLYEINKFVKENPNCLDLEVFTPCITDDYFLSALEYNPKIVYVAKAEYEYIHVEVDEFEFYTEDGCDVKEVVIV